MERWIAFAIASIYRGRGRGVERTTPVELECPKRWAGEERRRSEQPKLPPPNLMDEMREGYQCRIESLSPLSPHSDPRPSGG